MGHLSIPIDGPPHFWHDNQSVDAGQAERHLRSLGGVGRMVHIDLTKNDGPVGALLFMPASEGENDKARYMIATLTGVHVLVMGPAVLTNIEHKSSIEALEEYES